MASRSVVPERVLAASKTLYPGYFALVMATGALSIAFFLLRYTVVADALLALNTCAYGVLSGLLMIRLLWFPQQIKADLLDYGRAPGFFTVVAGTLPALISVSAAV